MFRKLLLGVFALAVAAPPAWAQSYRIDAWTADNGLPSSAVNRVLQTRDGFIWLTTFAGLVRYDGATFEVFNTGTTPQLRSSRFTNLFEDRDGNLWASTEGQGLARHKDGAFHFYAAADGVAGLSAMDFFYDGDGRLLLDSRAGLVAWTGTRFEPAASGVPTASRDGIRSIFRMADGAAWYLDGTGGHKFDGRRIVENLALPPDTKWIFEDPHGRLWIEAEERGGVRYLMLRENGVIRRFSAADGVPPFRTMSVSGDRDGAVWFGLSGQGGLLRYAGGRFTRFSTADGLPSDNVGAVFQDREGTIWVPTEGGLARILERAITPYSTADGLAADNVYPVYEDRAGTVWIGSWMGLTQYRDGALRSVGREFGAEGKNVMALHEDRDGAMWIGLWGDGGLLRIAGGVIDDFNRRAPAGDIVRAIAQDATGAMWLGGSSLTRYSNGVFQRFTAADGFAGRAIYSIRAGRDGRLWVGTDIGLSVYRDGAFINYGASQGMTGSVVRSIYEDSDGVVWAGTYDTGLFRFENGRFRQFTIRDGLFDNGAFQILEDAQGQFWISGNAGIYRIARASLNAVARGEAKGVQSAPYGKRDGMLTAECNGGGQPAGVRTRDGRLWFPTQKGVVVIDADRLRINRVAPPVVITGLSIDRQAAALAATVAIRPDQNAFEISYAGLTFAQPELTRFRYKLEGLDTEWVDAGHRRTAYFSHVPYGSYRFVVTAANRDGVWNEAGASLVVSVVPPFWRTRAFQAAMTVALVAVVTLAYRRRIRALERTQAMRDAFSQQLLDSQEVERKRIAAELHDSVGQTLIVINNWALAGVNAAGDPQSRARWSQVSSTASAAIDEVREIAFNLGPHQMDRMGLADTILDMVDRVTSASGIRIDANIEEVDGLLPRSATISVYRIVQESVNNIVKHSQATAAEISLRIEPAWLVLTITDNGTGFDVAAARAARQGFGLRGLSERARMLGGACQIESAPAGGTRITVYLPYRGPA